VAWKREIGTFGEPGWQLFGAGEAAYSPEEAAALGYEWRGGGGTYGRAPTTEEYAGILEEKLRLGHYKQEMQRRIEAELQRLRAGRGEPVIPPWGTPKKWHPYITAGQFKSPEVRAFEARWAGKIKDGEFTGGVEEYSDYQRDRAAAEKAQEEAYGRYSLEQQFRQQRLQESYEGALEEESQRLWETGAFSMGREPEPTMEELPRTPWGKVSDWLGEIDRRVSGTRPITAMKGALITTKREMPEELREWPVPHEFTFGEIEGTLKKPATTAGLFGVSAALPAVFRGTGRAISPVSRAASRVFPRAGPAVAKWAPRAFGAGLAAGYGVSVEERLRKAPAGARAGMAGEIYATEFVPMATGYAMGAAALRDGALAGETIKATRQVKRVEYDVIDTIKADAIDAYYKSGALAESRQHVRFGTRAVRESDIPLKDRQAFDRAINRDIQLGVEYERTLLSERGVTAETGKGFFMARRKPGGWEYDLLPEESTAARLRLAEQDILGLKPSAYRFGRPGVTEEVITGRAIDQAFEPRSAKGIRPLSEYTEAGTLRAIDRDVARRLSALQIGGRRGAPVRRPITEAIRGEAMLRDMAASEHEVLLGGRGRQVSVLKVKAEPKLKLEPTAKDISFEEFKPKRILGKREIIELEEYTEPGRAQRARGILLPMRGLGFGARTESAQVESLAQAERQAMRRLSDVKALPVLRPASLEQALVRELQLADVKAAATTKTATVTRAGLRTVLKPEAALRGVQVPRFTDVVIPEIKIVDIPPPPEPKLKIPAIDFEWPKRRKKAKGVKTAYRKRGYKLLTPKEILKL